MIREKILLTPAKAKSLLDENYKNNRRVRPSKVVQLALDISEGRWNENISEVQDPICVSKSGELLNGQHRCLAVIRANKPINTWITYGVDEHMYEFFDGASQRTVSDFVNLPCANNIAALAKVAYAIVYGSSNLASAMIGHVTSGRPSAVTTKQQTLWIIREENEALERYFRLAQKASVYIGKSNTNVAIAFFTIDFVGRGDVLERFAEEMGKLVPEALSVISLRSHVAKCISNKNFKRTRKWMASCIFSAYEAFRDSRPIQSFNKIDSYFSKYDKLVADERNAREEAQKWVKI